MVTPVSSNFKQLTSADMLKFKAYLVENVSRMMEGESLVLGDRAAMIKERLKEVYTQTKVNLPDDMRNHLFAEILDEFTGFGPIQPLLDDPDVSEVMVNGPNKVFIEKNGRFNKKRRHF